MKTSSHIALVLVVLGFFSGENIRAMFMSPELVPVDRLVKSADAYIAKHPKDADAHYTLARIHYLAFATQRDRVAAYPNRDGDDDKPSVADDQMSKWVQGQDKKTAAARLGAPELIAHAAKALGGFNEALRLNPKGGLYALGLASLLEEFWRWNDTAKPTEQLPAELQGITIRRFREAYSKAFALAMIEDSKLKTMPITGPGSIVAHEAAAALVRLAENNRDNLTEEDKGVLQSAQKAVVKFEKLPWGAITPIVFSLHPAAHLDEMLDPARTVDFDLRGYGPPARWPWVKAELGFLVWDPLETGCVQSARQMFGSYTFQIFRRTGYDALAALDDNADGHLSGPELAGLSVWFDRDGDGRSAAGEVLPLRTLGVESIAVTATTRDGIHPANPRGLTLRDGRTLPTWDWIVEPVR